MQDTTENRESLGDSNEFLGNLWKKQAFYWYMPLVVLIVLLSLFILWLLIPGNRQYPADGISNANGKNTPLELTKLENSTLSRQIERLESAIETAVCLDNGTLLLPEGRSPYGILPELRSEPSTESSRSIPNPVLPSTPGQYIPSFKSGDSNPESLVELIENTTVLILNAEEETRGSGIFITPDLIVSNDHVISGSGGKVFVVGASFDHVMQAEVIASTGSSDFQNDDFALLRIPNWNNPYVKLRDPKGSIQLHSVFAAGFPGDITEYDIAFDKLISGDMSANPSVVITDGIVNAVTQHAGGGELIMHSASISFGNSGGPLLDTCGNLLGINTFVQSGTIRSIHFALPTDRLGKFLFDNGMKVSITESDCSPEVRTEPVENTSNSAQSP